MELPQYIQNELFGWIDDLRRPSVLFRPKLSLDGDMWCALLGDNLQEGCAGFGKSPELAFLDFDREFYKIKAPTDD